MYVTFEKQISVHPANVFSITMSMAGTRRLIQISTCKIIQFDDRPCVQWCRRPLWPVGVTGTRFYDHELFITIIEQTHQTRANSVDGSISGQHRRDLLLDFPVMKWTSTRPRTLDQTRPRGHFDDVCIPFSLSHECFSVGCLVPLPFSLQEPVQSHCCSAHTASW